MNENDETERHENEKNKNKNLGDSASILEDLVQLKFVK